MRSTTGKNLRMLMLLTERSNVDEICREDYKKIDYHKIKDEEQWRLSLIDEIIDIRYKQLDVEGFESEEIEEILNYVCTS